MTADARLDLADTLDREAEADWKAANWFMDLATTRCAEKREKARKLREAVQLDREAAAIQAEADRELVRRGKRRRAA